MACRHAERLSDDQTFLATSRPRQQGVQFAVADEFLGYVQFPYVRERCSFAIPCDSEQDDEQDQAGRPLTIDATIASLSSSGESKNPCRTIAATSEPMSANVRRASELFEPKNYPTPAPVISVYVG